MDNQEQTIQRQPRATLDIQDTEQSVVNTFLEKTEWEIKSGQSRETGNIGHTRHMTNTSKRQRKPKGQSRMDNPEKQATLGTQDT